MWGCGGTLCKCKIEKMYPEEKSTKSDDYLMGLYSDGFGSVGTYTRQNSDMIKYIPKFTILYT